MPNYLRSCTDVLCIVALVIVLGGFVGLMIYGLVDGDPLAVIALYNSDGIRCNTNPTFPCTFLVTQLPICPTASTERSAW